MSKEKQTDLKTHHSIARFTCLPIRSESRRKDRAVQYFIDDNINSVLEEAKKDAGDKDVRISGSAGVIRKYLDAGLIDEFGIHVARNF